jgi:hypothetical protein
VTTSTKPSGTVLDHEDDIEGDCPTCGHGPWLIDGDRRVPAHDQRRNGAYAPCPGANEPASNQRPRPYMYVEGLVFL